MVGILLEEADVAEFKAVVVLIVLLLLEIATTGDKGEATLERLLEIANASEPLVNRSSDDDRAAKEKTVMVKIKN